MPRYCDRYVWLVPEYTYNVNDAATAFEVRIQGGPDPELGPERDLARGAKGDWRYLRPVCDHRESRKIVEVKLLRSPDGHVKPEAIPQMMGPKWWATNFL